MPIDVAAVLSSLGRITPLDKAAGWDAVGLQVGDPSAEVTSAGVCHEVTEEITAELEQDPVDLLVAYHPLLFGPVPTFVAGPSAAGRAYRLARMGVAVASVHTAFDVAPGGTSDALADAFELSGRTGFGPAWPEGTKKFVTFVPPADVDRVVAATAAAGAGTIGNYHSCSFRSVGTGAFHPLDGADPTVGTPGTPNTVDEVRVEIIAPPGSGEHVAAALVAAHPYEEPAYDVYAVEANAGMIGRFGELQEPATLERLAGLVADRLGASVRVAGPSGDPVRRVAVVPGSGASFIGTVAGKADVLITGDVGHHRAREALDRGLSVIDAGHVPTERPGVDRLYASVAGIVPGARHFDLMDPHPWKELEWRS